MGPNILTYMRTHIHTYIHTDIQRLDADKMVKKVEEEMKSPEEMHKKVCMRLCVCVRMYVYA